jgi:hypothetical protein
VPSQGNLLDWADKNLSQDISSASCMHIAPPTIKHTAIASHAFSSSHCYVCFVCSARPRRHRRAQPGQPAGLG